MSDRTRISIPQESTARACCTKCLRVDLTVADLVSYCFTGQRWQGVCRQCFFGDIPILPNPFSNPYSRP